GPGQRGAGGGGGGRSAGEAHEPLRGRVEGEREDGRPHERREEPGEEDVELEKEEGEDDEEERGEQALLVHAQTRVTTKESSLTLLAVVGTRTPSRFWRGRHVAQWESASLTRKRPAAPPPPLPPPAP